MSPATPNPMMSAHRPQPSSTEEGFATAAAMSSNADQPKDGVAVDDRRGVQTEVRPTSNVAAVHHSATLSHARALGPLRHGGAVWRPAERSSYENLIKASQALRRRPSRRRKPFL